MSFPRYEDLELEDHNYRQDVRWRLFIDPTGELPGKQVLVSMGEFWTLLSADDFRALAERILRQL
jgi:hypothetical protein